MHTKKLNRAYVAAAEAAKNDSDLDLQESIAARLAEAKFRGFSVSAFLRHDELEEELNQAETKAWDALAKYKFMMFGYWAAVWVHLNRVGQFKEPNPWKRLVHEARKERADDAHA